MILSVLRCQKWPRQVKSLSLLFMLSPKMLPMYMSLKGTFNRTAHIRHQCKKTIVSSCHRCLIKNGVEKNEQPLNIVQNFDHQMSLNKRKCWYSNNCLHFLKPALPLSRHSHRHEPNRPNRIMIFNNTTKAQLHFFRNIAKHN